jgi:hypothetical protein
MEIELEGELTEQDVKQAITLGYPPWFPILRVGLTLVFVVPLVYNLYGSCQILVSGEVLWTPANLLITILPSVLLSLFVAAFLYVLWLLPRRQARRFLRTPLGRARLRGLATDETLALGSEAAESTTRWDAYVQYRMSEGVVLLYQNDAAANMVPRSLFASEEDWERFRQHVQDTVPQASTKVNPILRWGVYGALALIILAIIFALIGGPRGSG